MRKLLIVLLMSFFTLQLAEAAVVAEIRTAIAEGKGQPLGSITVRNSQYGLLIEPNLSGLEPGLHGLHIHTVPNCAAAAAAAGGHFDPKEKGKHFGPYRKGGHLGDLPALYVDEKGRARTPLLAPRLTERKARHHAIVIHSRGDNYSDEPKANGGGGPRIACGVIKWLVAE